MSNVKNILVLFYGIGRSPSCMKKNIEILKKKNKYSYSFKFNFAYALNSIKRINNPRTSEFIDIDKSIILSSINIIDIFYEIDQNIFENEFYNYLNLNKKIKIYDPYNDQFKTLCNLFCQLSLLSKFFKNNDLASYDSYLVIRDDVLIIDESGLFSGIEIISKTKKNVFITSFHWHGGVNDRIIVLNDYGNKLFNERLFLLKKQLKNNTFKNSERINLEAIENLSLRIISTPIKILRFRANGIKRAEVFLLRPYRVFETMRIIVSFIRFCFFYTKVNIDKKFHLKLFK